jgi:hypothetical protein
MRGMSMMDDYISRQAAIDGLNEQIAYCDKALGSFEISMKDEYAVKVERASLIAYKGQLESIPAADVVPVVRCRDCKHWALYPSTTSSNLHECKAFGFAHLHTAEMEFCSRGERKE